MHDDQEPNGHQVDDDVGIWPFDPSDEAKKTAETLRSRWIHFREWLRVGSTVKARIAVEKIAQTGGQITALERFFEKWDRNDANTGELQTAVQDLEVLERNAKDYGYKPGERIVAPEIEQGTPAMQGAAAADRVAKGVESAASDLKHDAEEGLEKIWKGIPLTWKIGAGVVVLGGIAAAIAAATAPARQFAGTAFRTIERGRNREREQDEDLAAFFSELKNT